MQDRCTIAWCPFNFWMVKVSGADRLKAHRSSDVCSEQTQSAHTQKMYSSSGIHYGIGLGGRFNERRTDPPSHGVRSTSRWSKFQAPIA